MIRERPASFVSFSPSETEALLDTLSGDDKFWDLVRQALLGKETAQGLGYEIMSRAEALDEYIHEQAEAEAQAIQGDDIRDMEKNAV